MAVSTKRPTLTIKVEVTDAWGLKRLLAEAPEIVATIEEKHNIVVKSVTTTG